MEFQLISMFEDKDEHKILFAPTNLTFSDLKDWVNVEIDRTSDQEDLLVELVKKIPATPANQDEVNHVVDALKMSAAPGKAKAYRMSDRRWVVIVNKKDL